MVLIFAKSNITIILHEQGLLDYSFKSYYNSPYGNSIKIYNTERCICDMLKDQDSNLFFIDKRIFI